jgi:hypothetical protein
MGIEEFEDLLADTITLEPPTGTDEYEKPTYGAAVTVKAHLSGKLRKVRDLQGEERVSTLSATVNGTPGATPAWRITLPVGWDPPQPQILAVLKAADENGAHHEVVYCA